MWAAVGGKFPLSQLVVYLVHEDNGDIGADQEPAQVEGGVQRYRLREEGPYGLLQPSDKGRHIRHSPSSSNLEQQC